jgi:pyruvate dehydrogenase E1 component alpha subunit
MSDSNAYRCKDEEKEWGQRDPVIILRDRLIEAGAISEDEYQVMDKAIIDEIENEIIPYCEQSPEPNVAELEKYVLADNDPWVRGGKQ